MMMNIYLYCSNCQWLILLKVSVKQQHIKRSAYNCISQVTVNKYWL